MGGRVRVGFGKRVCTRAICGMARVQGPHWQHHPHRWGTPPTRGHVLERDELEVGGVEEHVGVAAVVDVLQPLGAQHDVLGFPHLRNR